MTTRVEDHGELLEPLRRFLETFTQDLTEQKFIPAFRDELGRLLGSLEELQQSEDTLQQIARGVERLREVFAPAGTRLLESVREVEGILHANAADLKSQAGAILTRLTEVHSQLEASLQGEAMLLSRQSAASREALAHATLAIEERLAGLHSRIDSLCRQAEERVAATMCPPVSSSLSTPSSSGNLSFDPDEFRQLLAQTTEDLKTEVARYREDLTHSITAGTHEQGERLAQLMREISETLAGLGPHLQDELRQAVAGFSEQIGALTAAKVSEPSPRKGEGGGRKSEHESALPAAATLAAITASENRILHEISEQRKARRQEWAHALEELQSKLARAYEIETARQKEAVCGVQSAVDSLKQTLNALHADHARAQQHWQESLAANDTGRFQEQLETLEQLVRTALSGMEDFRRGERERAEYILRELRPALDSGIAAARAQEAQALAKLAEDWRGELAALRDSVRLAIDSAGDALTDHLRALQVSVSNGHQADQAVQQAVRQELTRIAEQTVERLDAIRESSSQWTESVTARQELLAQQIELLISRQSDGLQVLREAVRENYDDSAGRLKQVIETAFDSFMKQAAAIPQALESYTRLIQSLHQADQIAMQALSSDTTNLLNLSAEKFDLLQTDSMAMKKFFPLLDRKLEKHAAELDALRKAQIRQDKEFVEIRESLTRTREKQETAAGELRDELHELHSQTTGQADATRADIARMAAELRGLQESDLPAFRRELAALLTSKFDFMETTTREREETLKNEILARLKKERGWQNRLFLLLGLLVVLGMAIHFGLVSVINSGFRL